MTDETEAKPAQNEAAAPGGVVRTVTKIEVALIPSGDRWKVEARAVTGVDDSPPRSDMPAVPADKSTSPALSRAEQLAWIAEMQANDAAGATVPATRSNSIPVDRYPVRDSRLPFDDPRVMALSIETIAAVAEFDARRDAQSLDMSAKRGHEVALRDIAERERLRGIQSIAQRSAGWGAGEILAATIQMTDWD